MSRVSFTFICSPGGQLEEALEQYKRSKDHGVERAAMHIRNVRLIRLEI